MGLDTVELVIAIEDKFQIEIEDKEAGEVRTVGDLHALVLAKLREQDLILGQRRPRQEAEVWEILCRVIVEQTGVARQKITPEASFYGDLRIS